MTFSVKKEKKKRTCDLIHLRIQKINNNEDNNNHKELQCRVCVKRDMCM